MCYGSIDLFSRFFHSLILQRQCISRCATALFVCVCVCVCVCVVCLAFSSFATCFLMRTKKGQRERERERQLQVAVRMIKIAKRKGTKNQKIAKINQECSEYLMQRSLFSPSSCNNHSVCAFLVCAPLNLSLALNIAMCRCVCVCVWCGVVWCYVCVCVECITLSSTAFCTQKGGKRG